MTSLLMTSLSCASSGSGIVVTVQLRESNLAPLFEPVDHSDSNDERAFGGDRNILRHYCRHPLPEMYELAFERHEVTSSLLLICKRRSSSDVINICVCLQGITTKADYYDCAQVRRQGGECVMETGYYLNPMEPCETYERFGRLPVVERDAWSTLCVRSSALTDVFGASAELESIKTMNLIDKTRR